MGTFCEYYTEIRLQAKEKEIRNAELLNARYLYQKADTEELKAVYDDIEKERKAIQDAGIPLGKVRQFFADWLSVWIGRTSEKLEYQTEGRFMVRGSRSMEPAV